MADEGLYYSTIYHNSHDLGIAEQAALRQNSAGRLAVGPPALSHQNPTVCSFACRCRLRSALWSLFQLSPARCLIVRPYAESKFSCRAVVVNILYCNFFMASTPLPFPPPAKKKIVRQLSKFGRLNISNKISLSISHKILLIT